MTHFFTRAGNIILLSLFLSQSLFAQDGAKTIKGIVYFEGKPIEAAYIMIPGDLNAITDREGRFELNVYQLGLKGIVVFEGAEPQEFIVDERDFYEFFLQPKSYNVGENVLITALGVERASKSVGYAIQQIDGESLTGVQSPNFLNNLAAKVAGVTITQGPTGVGSTSKITIRGESSFTNNNPLFVVDGVILNNNSLSILPMMPQQVFRR